MDATLDQIGGEIVARFERTSAARDAALIDGRQAIRACAASIRELHRGEIERAKTSIDGARILLDRVRDETAREPSVSGAGYVLDAMKEYAEARLLLAIVTGEEPPSPSDLGVEDAPYLNGLAEAASELRRLILHLLRGDDVERVERLLAIMNAIYDMLITIDFPDAITGGLRRATDQLRAVLERTRGDVALTLNQRRLERAVREHQLRLDHR